MEDVWTFEHAIHCSVSKDFAWDFWTNVMNWELDADIELVELQGPFEAGTRGITYRHPARSSGASPRHITDMLRSRFR